MTKRKNKSENNITVNFEDIINGDFNANFIVPEMSHRYLIDNKIISKQAYVKRVHHMNIQTYDKCVEYIGKETLDGAVDFQNYVRKTFKGDPQKIKKALIFQQKLLFNIDKQFRRLVSSINSQEVGE